MPVSRLRLFQAAVALAGLVPVGAGVAGVLLGAAMLSGKGLPGAVLDRAGDSHFRYLSGLLLGIGLCFWAMIPRIDRAGGGFRLLTVVVFVGGLARLLGVILHGAPGIPMLGGLGMELVVTPLLCLWQYRVQRAAEATPG